MNNSVVHVNDMQWFTLCLKFQKDDFKWACYQLLVETHFQTYTHLQYSSDLSSANT
jgi:hypothetical protein